MGDTEHGGLYGVGSHPWHWTGFTGYPYPVGYDKICAETTSKKEAAMKKPAKVRKVMREYKKGTLKSSSGSKVKSRKQAVAIAMSEAGMSRTRKRGRR